MSVRKYNTPVAETVSKIISQKGLKQVVIAGKMGITDQQFSDMLNGRRIIKACDITRLAEALDVTPNELFQYKLVEE